MSSNFLELADVVEPISRADPAHGLHKYFDYIDITSVDRHTKTVVTPTRIATAHAPSRARQLLRPGDVLVSTVRPNLNSVAIVPAHLKDAVGSTGFCVLRANAAKVLPRFLYYYVQSKPFIAHLTQIANGASYPAVTDDDVHELRFVLPSLQEQEHLVAKLDMSSEIRRTRRYALKLCDEFLPAAFHQMFGDYRRNPKGYPTSPVSELCNLVRGSSPRPQGDPRFFGGPIPRLMISDITRDGIMVTPLIDSLTIEGAARSRPMPAGSVVMAVSANVGLPAILKIDACIHDGFVGFRELAREVSPIFLYFHLLARKSASSTQATGAIWQNITTDQINEWALPIPPMSEQDQFAAAAAQHHRIRATHVEALRQADHLFQTLLHDAFSN